MTERPYPRNGMPWTDAEDTWITSLYWQGKSSKEISDFAGRTPGSIKVRLYRLGQNRYQITRLNAALRAGIRWTPAEDAKLLELVEEGMTNFQIAAALGRTPAGVMTRLGALDKGPLRGAQTCQHIDCGAPVVQNETGGQRRRYCSRECRLKMQHIRAKMRQQTRPGPVHEQAGRPASHRE